MVVVFDRVNPSLARIMCQLSSKLDFSGLLDLQFNTSFIMSPVLMGISGPSLPALLPLPLACLPLAVVSISRVKMAFFGLANLLLMPKSFVHAT